MGGFPQESAHYNLLDGENKIYNFNEFMHRFGEMVTDVQDLGDLVKIWKTQAKESDALKQSIEKLRSYF